MSSTSSGTHGSNGTILEVKSLKKYFPIKKGLFKRVAGYVKAVDNVSFSIKRGETLGLVGESGCGKTTIGKCLVRGIEPTEGSILYRLEHDDRVVDFGKMTRKELRPDRRYVQMVFQDPYGSLDPRMTIMDIIGEPFVAQRIEGEAKIRERVKYLMEVVGLNPGYLNRYPHAFSGGQRQRVAIARALALNPEFIVADEPVSALDVSVQAQVVNLLDDLQEKFNLTYLFISHDLSVIDHISDRVVVMYVGRMVELAETEELYTNPKHPYTEVLMTSVPRYDTRKKRQRYILPGEVANPADPPPGCHFHPRCKYAVEICKNEIPELREVTPGHVAACHLADELTLEGIDAG